MSDDTITDLPTGDQPQDLRSVVDELLKADEKLRAKEVPDGIPGYREMVAEISPAMKVSALYRELKTHIQDVLNDTGAWDQFDTEKLAEHGIVKRTTEYECEYEVKYTGSIMIKADSEEAARKKADEIVTSGISTLWTTFAYAEDVDGGRDIKYHNHDGFVVEITACDEW